MADAALLHMAKVINEADTGRLDADPLAAGFEAMAVAALFLQQRMIEDDLSDLSYRKRRK